MKRVLLTVGMTATVLAGGVSGVSAASDTVISPTQRQVVDIHTSAQGCAKSPVFLERNLQFHPRIAGRCLAARFPGITGIAQHHSPRTAASGQELQVMVGFADRGRRTGDRVARHLVSHASQYRVVTITWRDRVWKFGRDSASTPIRKWRTASTTAPEGAERRVTVTFVGTDKSVGGGWVESHYPHAVLFGTMS